MTRVNIGIKPQQLIDQHLIAEHREIKRIPALFKARLSKNKFNDIPLNFSLNTGHVKFFLDKGDYTKFRYIELYKECLNRKFKITNFLENWSIYSYPHNNDYLPTTDDTKIIIERLKEKILTMKPEPRYYGKIISREDAIKLLCL